MAIFHDSNTPCRLVPTILSLCPGPETDQKLQSGSVAPQLVGPELCSQWRAQLDDLLGRCTPHRTTIGVVGNTGAGKRSPTAQMAF